MTNVANGTCSVQGCEKPTKARGWCTMHWTRWSRHGDPLWEPPTSEARFWSYVDKNGPDGIHSQTSENLGPCWLWITPTGTGGYGRLKVDGVLVKAHRFAYELLVGPIPPGLELDHLCRVPACTNPAHLEPVTSAENTRRGLAVQATTARFAAMREVRTHCPHGHPANEYLRNSAGNYKCRTCERDRTRRRRRVWRAAH
jgi:hypothetical protein